MSLSLQMPNKPVKVGRKTVGLRSCLANFSLLFMRRLPGRYVVLMKHIEKVPAKVREIYKIVGELEAMFGRHFTPDGHMVGSIGEVLAAYHYDLELLPASAETHDAIASNGVKVQIKATQGKTIGIRSEPEHLIVLGLLKDGTNQELYNGSGSLAWNNAGKMQKNGQRAIGVSKLRKLMESVADSDRLPRKTT